MDRKKPGRKAEPPSKRGIAWPRWTGFRGKTIWDWLQLLIVPLMLVAIGFFFTVQQDARQERTENQRAEAEQELARQRAQDEALQAYLDQMSTLLLEKDLRASTEDNATEDSKEARNLARARTLTVLQRLDPSRKTQVMQFLVEGQLVQQIEGRAPIISLSKYEKVPVPVDDPREVGGVIDVIDSSTVGSGVDLSGVDLSSIYLSDAELLAADLSGANLSSTYLSDADLSYADLSGADLSYADLSGADLFFADLSGADLRGATVTPDQLEEAFSIDGATKLGRGRVEVEQKLEQKPMPRKEAEEQGAEEPKIDGRLKSKGSGEDGKNE